MLASNLITLAEDAAATPMSAVQGVFGFLGVLTLVAVVAVMFPAVRRVQALFAPCVILITIAVTVLAVGLVMVALFKMQPAA